MPVFTKIVQTRQHRLPIETYTQYIENRDAQIISCMITIVFLSVFTAIMQRSSLLSHDLFRKKNQLKGLILTVEASSVGPVLFRFTQLNPYKVLG